MLTKYKHGFSGKRRLSVQTLESQVDTREEFAPELDFPTTSPLRPHPAPPWLSVRLHPEECFRSIGVPFLLGIPSPLTFNQDHTHGTDEQHLPMLLQSLNLSQLLPSLTHAPGLFRIPLPGPATPGVESWRCRLHT